jgi:FkbM family methyltransferase
MKFNQGRDRLIESLSFARRIYGIKLLFTKGWTENTKWFLLDHERMKYCIRLKKDGWVLDFGAYKGDYTATLLKRGGSFKFKIYEPVPEFYEICNARFKGNINIEVYNKAVSSDGRALQMEIDGPRTRLQDTESLLFCESISIEDALSDMDVVELVKMNIEGMEYECLETAINAGLLGKVNNLLIQFHNFETNSEIDYRNITNLLEKDFTKVFGYKWLWEHWKRSSALE